MKLNRIVLVATTLSLVVLNVTSFTVGGIVVAALLAAAALALLWQKISSENGIFVFLAAELSPLGLHSELALALLYQAISLLLLGAVFSSFESLHPLAEYRSAAVKVAVAVSAFLAVSAIVLHVKPLYASDPQISSLLIGGALTVLVGLLLIDHYNIRLRRPNILRGTL